MVPQPDSQARASMVVPDCPALGQAQPRATNRVGCTAGLLFAWAAGLRTLGSADTSWVELLGLRAPRPQKHRARTLTRQQESSVVWGNLQFIDFGREGGADQQRLGIGKKTRAGDGDEFGKIS